MNVSASAASFMAGECLVGVVGSDVPRQIILASQATPVRIFGTWDGPISAEAAQMLGAVDAVATRILGELLSGSHDRLSGLVISNDSMANLRLFYVARLLSQQGRLPFPVQLVDAPRGAGEPRRRFVTYQFAQLAQFTAEISGRAPSAESTLSAAEQEQEVGAALRRMRQRRLSGQCSGAEALRAYRAAMQHTPEEAVRIIDDAVTTGLDDAQRIFITGSSHPDESLYAVLESTGTVIVSEDHDAGDSSWIGEAVHQADVETLLEQLASHHAARPPLAARALSHERVDHLRRRIEETHCVGAAALIRELDDAPVWDLPGQKQELRAQSIPLAAQVRIPPGEAIQAAHSVLREMTQPGWGNQQ